jgi:hypothetical protein
MTPCRIRVNTRIDPEYRHKPILNQLIEQVTKDLGELKLFTDVNGGAILTVIAADGAPTSLIDICVIDPKAPLDLNSLPVVEPHFDGEQWIFEHSEVPV